MIELTWGDFNNMSKQDQLQKIRGRFLQYMKGDQAAAAFLEQVYFIAHFWDDLIDKDNPVSNDTINAAMWMALIEMPRNPFYRNNMDYLLDMFQVLTNQWFDANELQTGDKEQVRYSFILKESLMTLISQCAYLIGGKQHMRAVSIDVQALNLTGEKMHQYVEKEYRKNKAKKGEVIGVDKDA